MGNGSNMASTYLLSVSPIVTIVFSLAILKRSAIKSAAYGLSIAILVLIFSTAFQFNITLFRNALQETLLLTTNIMIVIVSGLYLNNTMKQLGYVDRILCVIDKLPYKNSDMILILLFGFIPAIEAFTGFGVSLFISIPIFLHLFEQKKALRLALLGMNIMPWGTLALATIIGAYLAKIELHKLGTMTSLTSFFVFPYLSIVATKIVEEKIKVRIAAKAIFAGTLFSIILFISNKYLMGRNIWHYFWYSNGINFDEYQQS